MAHPPQHFTMRNLFIIICCSYFLISCQNQKPKDNSICEKFELESFKICDMSNESCEIISHDSMLFAAPSIIRIVTENLLAIKDMKNKENVICFINPVTRQYKKTLSTGKSTKEIIYISSIWCQNSSLYVYDDTGKILKIDCNPNTLETKISLFNRIKSQGIEVAPMLNGLYLMEHTEGRYQIISSDGEAIDTVGIFPTEEYPKDVKIINAACQVDMATSPDTTHIVCTNRDWNKIEIFTGKGKMEHYLSGPIEIDAKIEKVEFPGGAYSVMQKPGYSVFYGSSTSTKGFMVGYIGKKNLEKQKNGFNTILSFDWNGKPKNRYIFNQNITHFDYDEKTKSIYCIVENERSYEIVKYVLNNEE